MNKCQEDEVSLREALRLAAGSTKTRNTRARWENVLGMWEQGKSKAEIAAWIGRSESTVRGLLKRAFRWRAKQPGFKWPVDETGKKICDVPHPKTGDANPCFWRHVRARTGRFFTYCPVCDSSFLLPHQTKESNDNRRSSTHIDD